MLNPQAIAQSLDANTLLITLLYLIKDQCTILALFIISANTRIQPICDKRSSLFVNKASVNISRRSVLVSSLMYVRPLTKLLICHQSCLLSAVILLFFRVNYLGNKKEVKRGFRLVYEGNIYTSSASYNVLFLYSQCITDNAS